MSPLVASTYPHSYSTDADQLLSTRKGGDSTTVSELSKCREMAASRVQLLTINVPLFKKLRDIIFWGGEKHFMIHFEGHFEGAKTFLTP
jgi:hypothetical protein